ncbi:HD domain-containing protein [Hydrogenophaga sp. SL48]|uniref:HD domain-containing protein n=1 Tax=Hydrogenophaga sp. SL48 TaxID=2806347 RepID=UPI001F1D4E7C|nr:HD domain-containing protein [Hydrogenophaga sp. SL48]UJW79414.1 HD domain-containing protein [Hydrogenophaga sp. SL48]
MSSSRYSNALALAARAHEGQVRKGTSIPYVTHPVAVAALVAQYGGDEDQQIAALLHDVLEDGGEHYASEIAAEFGPRVLAIVRGCTDGTPDATGEKAPWQQRKEAYLAHLASAGEDVWMVSGCDKLSNARAILEDLNSIGLAVFDRFTAKKEGTLWYYRSLSQVFTDAEAPVCEELTSLVAQIEELATAAA